MLQDRVSYLARVTVAAVLLFASIAKISALLQPPDALWQRSWMAAHPRIAWLVSIGELICGLSILVRSLAVAAAWITLIGAGLGETVAHWWAYSSRMASMCGCMGQVAIGNAGRAALADALMFLSAILLWHEKPKVHTPEVQ